MPHANHPWNDLDDLEHVRACDVRFADEALNELVAIKDQAKVLKDRCEAAISKFDLDEASSLACSIDAEMEDLTDAIARGVKLLVAADERRFAVERTRLLHSVAAE